MPRKQGTLEQQRNSIKREYKRGKQTSRRVRGVDALASFELDAKKQVACFLKASDFSYTYIGDALDLSKDVVRSWFADDEEMQKRTAQIQEDLSNGAIKLLKTYAVELVEILIGIARSAGDEKVALNATLEGLDRIGITKVNKSESLTKNENTNKDEVDITDQTGFLALLEGADPAVQAEAAEKLQDLFGLVTAHTA